VRNVFSGLDATRQPVRKTKNRIAMALIDLKESRRFASPCPFKQKFVCDSVWQAALDSAGIVPTSITGKRPKDTPVEQDLLAISAVSNTEWVTESRAQLVEKPEPDRPWLGATIVKPWRWMHLEAKRLTEKYRASKMFLLPILSSFCKGDFS
jgi:hypothetical protein